MPPAPTHVDEAWSRVKRVATAPPAPGTRARHAAPDGLRSLLRGTMALAVVAAIVATALFWRAAPRPIGPEGGASVAAAGLGTPASRADENPSQGARLVVHVVGSVRKPGVVDLPPGSRVSDAVQAAGGLRRGTDPASINLARPVSDGEQVVVGAVGLGKGASNGPTGSSVEGRVSLNTADVATLETLDGVGPVLAGRIIEWREANGGFTSIDDLRRVSGIGPKIFASLEDQVQL